MEGQTHEGDQDIFLGGAMGLWPGVGSWGGVSFGHRSGVSEVLDILGLWCGGHLGRGLWCGGHLGRGLCLN